MKKILYSLQKAKFDRIIKRIRYTAPINSSLDEEITIVSMVSTSTVDMYLTAIKSFLKYFGRGTVEAIDDGSLSEDDVKVLKHHIPNIQFSNANDIETFDSPSYVSWKRLYRVQQLAQKSYVIQLDSDTLTIGPLVDIDHAVRNNEGFLIGSSRWPQAVNVNTLRDIVSQWKSEHVQARAEANFHKLDFFKGNNRYLRGCAGFAGYPKNFATVEEIRNLSNEIYQYVGSDWKKWGSEQTTTMCLISKCKNSKILPWPIYQNFDFPRSYENIASMNFVHFIGSNRYRRGVYAKLANNFIKTYG